MVNNKHKIAATGALLGLSKGCLVAGIMFGVIASIVAATIPNAPKPKFLKGGRRYL